MNWMSRPSILVTNCGRALSFASALRQSYDVPQYWTSGLQLLELHALGEVVDGLALGPAGGRDAPAQVIDLGLRNCALNGRIERSSPRSRCWTWPDRGRLARGDWRGNGRPGSKADACRRPRGSGTAIDGASSPWRAASCGASPGSRV